MNSRIISILIYILFILYAFNSNASEPYWKQPKSILSEVENKNANKIFNKIYSNDKAWVFVIKKIESGKSEWIDVAIVLQKLAGAGASSELHDSLFAAIKNNPLYMLSNNLIVCDGRHDPLRTYKDALNEVNATIEALKSINVKTLESDIEFCTNSLEKSKSHLKKFFVVE